MASFVFYYRRFVYYDGSFLALLLFLAIQIQFLGFEVVRFVILAMGIYLVSF
jgi:hypothetical protein